MASPKIEAVELLEDLGLLTLPVVPEEVCRAMSTNSCEISFIEEPMSSDEFHGISMGDMNGAAILVNSNIENRYRKRFTSAHEVGHVHLHILNNLQSQFKCTSKDISSGESSNDTYEKEANEFAASFLMPEPLISTTILRTDLSWALVEKLRSECDVSLEAAARRVIDVSTESCCLIIHKNGEMWSPIKSKKFSAFIQKQPFPNSLFTEPDISSRQSFSTEMDECDFEDWSFPRKSRTGILYYCSIRNEEFDRTMTILLHDEDFEDDDNDDLYEAHF